MMRPFATRGEHLWQQPSQQRSTCRAEEELHAPTMPNPRQVDSSYPSGGSEECSEQGSSSADESSADESSEHGARLRCSESPHRTARHQAASVISQGPGGRLVNGIGRGNACGHHWWGGDKKTRSDKPRGAGAGKESVRITEPGRCKSGLKAPPPGARSPQAERLGQCVVGSCPLPGGGGGGLGERQSERPSGLIAGNS